MLKKKKKIFLRYGELVLKGKNRQEFIRKIEKNMKKVEMFPNVKYDHMTLDFSQENLQKIKYIFGLSSYSITYFTEPDIDVLSSEIIEYLKEKYFNINLTFKVESKRKDKSFGINSDLIKRYIAGKILQNTFLTVDVKNFDLKINVVIDKNEFYFYIGKTELLNGLPLGISGKAIHLISGGFDSPVAAFLMMKRGFEVEFVNFITPPHTDELTVKKTKMILEQLSNYQTNIKLHLLKYTDLMNYIGFSSNQAYKITLMRRSFYRISSKIAEQAKSLIISNGENIGQVASQTPESIFVIQKESEYPIIRPLATYDKKEIIDLAKKIGTHDISIIKSSEACELFAPKSPTTKPFLRTVKNLEKELDKISAFEKEILEKEEIIFFNYTKEEQ